MRAALVETVGGGFVTQDVDIATPLGREVLVQVKASGLCHTDLTWSRTDVFYPPPSVLGHEVSGIVSALGPDASEFSVGDHVVACLLQYCGKCKNCLAGKVYQCLDQDSTLRAGSDAPRLSQHGRPVAQGFGIGGFAEQCLVHESQLVAVSKDVPFPQAALLGCAVVTGAGAVLNSADVQTGDALVVIGVGGVGLNAISGGVIAGAGRVIAVDVADDKLEKAKRFGATHTVNSTEVDPVEAVKEITRTGADAVIDFVGIPTVTAQGLEMLAVGGGLYLIGSLDPSGVLPVATLAQIGGQRRVQGVIMGSTVPRRDIPKCADLYLRGELHLDDLVSQQISIDEVEQGYAALRDSATTRVVITF